MPPRSRQSLARGAAPVLRTAPVLAVLVCHNGAEWLRPALSALRHSTPRPRHVIAVDTGSTDDTPALLAAAAEGDDQILDGVLTLDRTTGYTAAVHAAVDHAVDRWGDPGGWIWLLHDDSAAEPDCLATLLLAAEVSPSAGVLGPLAVDWHDPRLVVEAGLSTDASGHRQTGIGPSELDWSRIGRGDDRRFEQSTEVLAVSSAGMLVRRAVWERLGGFDRALPLLREDVDFGWRANRAGHVVLCVPSARIRHARAIATERRGVDVVDGALGATPRVLDRAHGVRTFLVNCATISFLIGVPRLAVLCLLRALGFAVQRRLPEARAELQVTRYLLGGGAGLRAARAQRAGTARSGNVRGLFTSRFTRLRNAVRGLVSTMVRRRVEADAALGRLPGDSDAAAVWLAPKSEPRKPLGPDALPAGAGGRPRRAGLRRPPTEIAVPLVVPDEVRPVGLRPSPTPRPSPVRRDGSTPVQPDLVLVRVDRGRVLRQFLLAPPLLLLFGLVALALVVNHRRLGLDLAGGRLLPVGDLGQVWAEYVDTWHGVTGGTAAPAPASLAVLGVLGAVLAPFGGVQAAVALLLLADLPLAGLSAYLATRRAPVRRWVRALLAIGYALLPPATAAVAQGRLDAVVVHILLPLLVAGITALLVRGRTGEGSWLSTTAGTAIGLAVVGAFSPMTHLVLVLVALGGFVLVPGSGARRGASLFLLVLMPLALLLPWPAVVIQHPGVLLHGVGARVTAPAASTVDLLSLHGGGPGAWPLVGLVVVVAALAGVLLRPHRGVLPGLGFAVVGVLAVVAVKVVPATPLGGTTATHAWAGTPLLLVGWGLVWTLLGVCRTGVVGARIRVPVRLVAVGGVVMLAVLVVGAVIPGRSGPLATGGGPRLANTLVAELAVSKRSVLILAANGDPTRQTTGRVPRLGDDDLAPTPSSVPRLITADRELRSGDPERVRNAVGRAAATGVLFVVLPSRAEGDVFRDRAGPLVADAPVTSDGRPVFRLLVPAGSAYLLSPDPARQALTGGPPPAAIDVPGVVPVDAAPPHVAVRVSDGPDGRLLVVAAEEEPGWTATVDGRPAAIVRAWGSSVAVSVPTRAAEVRVEQPAALRGVLLLTQGAVLLFALLTSIPGRRR
ncbi:glycosyltransferase family 2 protein [Actinokineospora sp. NBRC 105648]|uniref:glycosyltransferase family 2 protein n=1 Tax=Actinokineospora sp. NBRC 105648 TaxID=3032206 RepID=UPI0024A1457C|nr:glycosyltransferase family 2 protein [Actinokineospora sp. NBRC 105648]GLZ38490.1 glycosyl transferase [Actinokineospora sp. NBRC 105648]